MFTIGAAARQTGITPATLRKWEARYGFPVPTRTMGDQRTFHPSDLVALHEISRRMANGERAGVAIQAVKLSHTRTMSNAMGSVAMDTPQVSHAIDLLLQSDLESLQHYLASHFTQQGAALFADQLAIPMIEVVGNLWQQGRLPVYAEHLFSSMLQKVVLGPGVSQGQTINPEGRVLLASPAGETHTLALVLLNAVLEQAGISTVFLQGGLPASEIAAAAAAFKVQVVALSVSRACPAKLLTAELRSLRALLDARADLWVGGEGTHRISARMDGVVFMPSIKTAVQALKNKFGYVPNLVGLIKDHNHG